MLKYLLLIGITVLTLTNAAPVLAAKPRLKKTSTSAVKSTGVSCSSAKLSRATNSIIVSFINLQNVSKISYELSYTADGIPKGAMGSIAVTGQVTDSRDLYFGTCSHGVCTPDANIYALPKPTLVIRTYLKNGAVNTKRYIIKL